MEKSRVLFEALEGKDELGTPKSACFLTVQRIISEEDTEVILSVGTQDAEVSVYSTPLWMIVDLRFEDRLDYDYLQFAQVCMEYLELAKDSDTEPLSLVLSLTPLGEYNYFVTGVSGAWNLMKGGICMDELYTVKEVSKILKVNVHKVYDLIRSGMLPALKLGNIEIRKESLNEFLKKYDGMDLTDLNNVCNMISSDVDVGENSPKN